MLSNIRAAQINTALIPPTADPKRILRDLDLSSRTAYNREYSGCAGSIEKEPNNGRKLSTLISKSQFCYYFPATTIHLNCSNLPLQVQQREVTPIL